VITGVGKERHRGPKNRRHVFIHWLDGVVPQPP
jgi:hypothetical protein